jgi:CBS-domain-containing membrane protein
MKLTDTLHPPAGANPVLVVMTGAPWWFVGVPVAAGAVILVVVAMAYHRVATGKAFPG